MLLSSKNKKKVSDLLSCYQELACGVPPQVLCQKYVKIEVIIAQELFSKGITLKALEDFVRRRDTHIESMLSSPSKKVVIFQRGLRRK